MARLDAELKGLKEELATGQEVLKKLGESEKRNAAELAQAKASINELHKGSKKSDEEVLKAQVAAAKEKARSVAEQALLGVREIEGLQLEIDRAGSAGARAAAEAETEEKGIAVLASQRSELLRKKEAHAHAHSELAM